MKLWKIAVRRRFRSVAHVARVAGGVAQPLDARHVRRAFRANRASDQAEPSSPFAVIGVDVLAKQRDLLHARAKASALRLLDDARDRPRKNSAPARVGKTTQKVQKPVAAFLPR